MVQTCSAYGCLNRFKKNSGITFHKFPSIKRQSLRKKWIFAMKRKGFQPGYDERVCSEHFKPEDFQTGLKIKSLKRDAIPKVVIGGKTAEVKVPRRVLKRVQLPSDDIPCAPIDNDLSLKPPQKKRAKHDGGGGRVGHECDAAAQRRLKPRERARASERTAGSVWEPDRVRVLEEAVQGARHLAGGHPRGARHREARQEGRLFVRDTDVPKPPPKKRAKLETDVSSKKVHCISSGSQTEKSTKDVAAQTCQESAQDGKKSHNHHLSDHNYAHSPFIDDLKRKCRYLEDVIMRKETNEDRLRQKIARLREKNLRLHNVISELRKESLVTKEAALFLGERFSDVEFKLIKGLVSDKNQGLAYQEEVKDFSITLYYYRDV